MKEIKLYNNKGIALVDDEDYEWLSEYKWHNDGHGYAKTKININDKWINQYMHKLLISTSKNMITDHVDRNRLNNQKNNLRMVTRSQNRMNSTKQRGILKYKGVSKYWNKWKAEIRFNNKNYYLGLFKNEIDAAKAYNEKAKELFNEYACLNKV